VDCRLDNYCIGRRHLVCPLLLRFLLCRISPSSLGRRLDNFRFMFRRPRELRADVAEHWIGGRRNHLELQPDVRRCNSYRYIDGEDNQGRRPDGTRHVHRVRRKRNPWFPNLWSNLHGQRWHGCVPISRIGLVRRHSPRGSDFPGPDSEQVFKDNSNTTRL
jgi:hypothetical protein